MSKIISLFGLATEFEVLSDLANNLEVNQETGEIIDNDEVIQELFQQIEGQLSDKLDNTNYVIKELEAKENALDTEIKRLTKRKKAFGSRGEVLISSMLNAIRATGKTKIETTFSNFSIRKSESVNITDEEKIGRSHMKMKLTIDKEKIRKDIKNGIEIDGAEMLKKDNLIISKAK